MMLADDYGTAALDVGIVRCIRKITGNVRDYKLTLFKWPRNWGQLQQWRNKRLKKRR